MKKQHKCNFHTSFFNITNETHSLNHLFSVSFNLAAIITKQQQHLVYIIISFFVCFMLLYCIFNGISIQETFVKNLCDV